MKKTFLLFTLIFSLLFPLTTKAQDNITRVYFFWGNGCPHCAQEKEFLSYIEKTNPKVAVLDFEIWNNSENRKILQKILSETGVKASGVPLTFISDQVMSGFNDYTKGEMENVINYCTKYSCKDPVGEIIGINNNQNQNSKPEENNQETDSDISDNKKIPEEINLPLVGKINTTSISLPILTIIIGALDGFNPCAMWVLIFLISLLLGMENKKRMWILGSAFIFGSALVYFLFLSAWLNLFLFLGVIVWVRALIGIVALLAGGYNLREYFVNKNGVCKVTGNENRQKIFTKLKYFVQSQSFWLALGGIILLAFAVNLVELICSAGLPAVYTQILALNELPAWQYYLYLILYILVFMLDDLIVFFIAMITLQMTGLSSKYSRYSHLIGGILMLILGALLILRPELLMFG